MPYSVTNHTIDAAYPRYPGATALVNDRLKLVYSKYVNSQEPPKDCITVNMIYVHGTGMNKAIWKYHIDALFKYAEGVSGQEKLFVKLVVALDQVSHGDSALANKGKLGWTYFWEEGGKDVLELIRHEQKTSGDFYNDITHKVIFVGHSLGATSGLFAASFDANVIDTVVAVEPVGYMSDDPELVARGRRRFQKLGLILKDTFQNGQQFESVFRKLPFYAKFDKRILDDFIADEKYTDTDGLVKSKSTVNHQLVTYFLSLNSVPHLMRLYSSLATHIALVTGGKSNWNPEAAPYIRNHIPSQYFSEHTIPEGEHCLNCERPDDLVPVINKVLVDRVRLAHANVANYPEVIFNGDRDKIVKNQLQKLFRPNYQDALFFVRPKL